ncbi:glycosyltransferase family 39 protein [bacterium]|nr:glycosyltransferase family 39 protein [bacterium]
MTRQQGAAAVAGMVAVATIVMIALAPYAYPFYDDDSTTYIEAGRNFAHGRGLVTWPYGTSELDREFVPLQLFPPGYPILISIAVRTGASAEAAATWIPRLCFVLLVPVLYGVLRFAMGRGAALAATAVSCFLPAVLFQSMCAMSDVVFLLFVLLAFRCLFRGVESGDRRWLLSAGLLAGCASVVRNAGYAAPIAVSVALLVCGHRRRIPLYLAGFAAAYAPLVVRNLRLFGTPLPYDMPPSDLTIPAVLREALRAFDEMFVARMVPWSLVVPALVLLALGSAVWLWRAGLLRQLPAARRVDLFAGAALLLYGAAGVGMILVTRLRFDVDPINPRFLIQYHWVLIAWCSALGAQALRVVRIGSPLLRAGATVALAGLLLAPQISVARTHAGHMAWSRLLASDHAGLRGVIALIPDGTPVVAFQAAQLHLLYERPVYQLPPISPAQAMDYAGDRPFVVVMFPYEYEQFHDWWSVFDGEMPSGYREIGRSGRVIALERPSPGP